MTLVLNVRIEFFKSLLHSNEMDGLGNVVVLFSMDADALFAKGKETLFVAAEVSDELGLVEGTFDVGGAVKVRVGREGSVAGRG
mgnify:CR=1 FL=1